MRVLPAIDLLDGQVVRLTKGDFSKKTDYPVSPVQMAQKLRGAGFSFIHIVGLDGAKDGVFTYADLLAEIQQTNVQVQYGGGVRTFETAKHLWSMGIDRIMLGTAAIENPQFWLDCVGLSSSDRFVLALDVKDGVVATRGWVKQTNLTVHDVIEQIGEENLSHVLVTDIERDGGLGGANMVLYQELHDRYPRLNIIPAGGVSSLLDLKQLEQIGIKEVVMGKALYEIPGLLDEIVNANYL